MVSGGSVKISSRRLRTALRWENCMVSTTCRKGEEKRNALLQSLFPILIPIERFLGKEIGCSLFTRTTILQAVLGLPYQEVVGCISRHPTLTASPLETTIRSSAPG